MSTSKEQLNLQYDAGQYLRKVREESKVSLSETARALGISKAYLSEIENGLKLPSDLLIRSLAKHYKIDEDDLFNRYGKIPMLAVEQLAEMPGFQNILSKIRRNKNLTEVQKQAISDTVEKIYKDFIESLDKNN